MLVIKDYQIYGSRDETYISCFSSKCDDAKAMSLKTLQFLCQVTNRTGALVPAFELPADENCKLEKPCINSYCYTTVPYFDADGIHCSTDLILFEPQTGNVLATITLDHNYKVRRWDAFSWALLQELLWMYCDGEFLSTEILGDDRTCYRYWDASDDTIVQIMEV